MLHVVKIGWDDSPAARIQQVLAQALQGQAYTLYENEGEFISFVGPVRQVYRVKPFFLPSRCRQEE